MTKRQKKGMAWFSGGAEHDPSAHGLHLKGGKGSGKSRTRPEIPDQAELHQS